jgi:hypothetical protein
MTRILIGALAALLCGLAIAATPTISASATGSWTGPINDANGVPLASVPAEAITSYNVYADTVPIADVPTETPISVSASSTTATATLTVSVGATIYMRVAACNVGGCSALSTQGTKVVTVPAPGVPTTVTITIKLTG